MPRLTVSQPMTSPNSVGDPIGVELATAAVIGAKHPIAIAAIALPFSQVAVSFVRSLRADFPAPVVARLG